MSIPIINAGGNGGPAPLDPAVVARMVNSGQALPDIGPQAPNRPKSRRNPVIAVYAMNDYVIYEREQPDEKTGMKRTPVGRRDALVRINHVMEGLFKDSGGKPQDETEYEKWLVEMTIKAAAESAKMMGRPYKSKDVDAKLFQLELACKGIKHRSDKV